MSTGLTDWDAAHELVRKWETSGGDFPKVTSTPTPVCSPKTLDEAWGDFLLRKTTVQKLSDSTVYKYRTLYRQMQEFARMCGLKFLEDFRLDGLEIFQAGWTEGPLTSLKKLERLKAFFNFAHTRGWIAENHAKQLQRPKFRRKETKPFEADEMKDILSAIDRYPDKSGRLAQDNAIRLRALVLLLRFSGLRLGDIVSCKVEHIQGNRICRITQKTGTFIKCPLPGELLALLKTMPRLSEQYFFWSGKSKLRTAVSSWQRTLRKLFKLAGIKGAFAHRFRDTFAVESLESGMTVERLAILLGHSNIQVTQRHYNPWVEARQKGLDADVERSWIGDEVLLMLRSGTQAVRREEPQKTKLFITGGKGVVPAVGLEPTT
jgi:integrase/recombinase XerD